ncbi:MAG: energy-coupling factor transporter transmembrane protein EcfT [Coriobacteriales bacterium]|nr:energy-coupling factor transporter transmembrane protein EcfT [Coriobacteriales bacterium]
MSISTSLPSWLKEEQNYAPQTDSKRYITKSLLKITSILKNLKVVYKSHLYGPSVAFKMLAVLVLIVITSVSRNYIFVLFMLACVLVFLCALHMDVVKRSIAITAPISLITFLVMLPAIIFGQYSSALLVASKVFITTSLATLCVFTSAPNSITKSLRKFKIPKTIIVMLDLAIRNIIILGKQAALLLNSLNVRSIGKNVDKKSAIGSIGGVLLIKTSISATTTYEAMQCRGFDGSYDYTNIYEASTFKISDLIWLAVLLVIIAIFIYFQIV